MHFSIFKTLLTAFLILVSGFMIFLIYIAATGYRAQDIEELMVESDLTTAGKLDRTVGQVVAGRNVPLGGATFNIGYCGLDQSQDFFMDGGKSSRSFSKEQTIANLQRITAFLLREEPAFILLQEVDVRSSRSFQVNQKEYLQTQLAGYSSTFGLNYKVSWVPAPLPHSMGSVYSGLLTLSSCKSDSAARYQYPGREKWPRQMFDLQRCFIENRLPVEGGKELVLINSHLSAFDEGGRIRQEQLKFLKNHITKEYQEKGNYVIVGGDWNHVLPGTDPELFEASEDRPSWLQEMPQDFTPEGFKWAVDKSVPSVRTTAAPYQEGFNYLAVIDGFLVSPNVEVLKVQGYQLNFENSDHNPVGLVFTLT